MGSLHFHHVAHHRLLYKLHAPTEESNGDPRDSYIHLWRFERTNLSPRVRLFANIASSAGMVVGLILLITSGDSIRNIISFDYQIFFNLLLPPIILSSGYELHQANFFRNIGTILTFAFAGTFLSAVVIGLILWIFNLFPGSLELTLVDAISVGATLSATDPVTILAIFNTYKVDPKLYTIIFGESILNDAIAIVIFETAQKYNKGEANYGIISFFEGTGIFLLVFFSSMLIGVIVGVSTALLLKFTYVRRFPKIESCLIILIAYATYFFSHGVHMSGKFLSIFKHTMHQKV
jgi:sodium/hydrogen exchanger-like protein 6/7